MTGEDMTLPSRKMASCLPTLSRVSVSKRVPPSSLKVILTIGSFESPAPLPCPKTSSARVRYRPVSPVSMYGFFRVEGSASGPAATAASIASLSTSLNSRSGVLPISFTASLTSATPGSSTMRRSFCVSATILLRSTCTLGSETPKTLIRRSMTSRSTFMRSGTSEGLSEETSAS